MHFFKVYQFLNPHIVPTLIPENQPLFQIIKRHQIYQKSRILYYTFINENLIIKYNSNMDKFRESRRKNSLRKESPLKLQTLSPDKYGKAAYNDMSYTPSRLAQNILYKETVGQKKNEETARRLRQLQANHKLLQDKYDKVSKEKSGIQDSLSKQIQMYRELIAEMEEKNDNRVKQIQQNFKQQMNNIIAEKEEEAKFAHAQKEELQDTIEDLQKLANELDEKLEKTTNNLQNMTARKEQLDRDLSNANEKISACEQLIKANSERAQEQIDNLKDKIVSTQKQWRDKKDEAVRLKDEEIKSIQKQHKMDMQKANEEREAERNQKNQELKDITNTFEAESKRQNQAIAAKEKAIQNLNKEASDMQQRILSLTQGYQQQVTNLTHQKCKLFQEVDALNQENTQLNVALRDLQLGSTKEKTNLQNYVLKLKQDLSSNQIHILRERDRNCLQFQDSSKQIIVLKKELAALKHEYTRLKDVTGDNDTLSREIRKLRELLNESSFELQKCKDEFVKLGKQRDFLLVKLEQVSNENNSLRFVKMEREEEARTWRDSYYINRAARRH